MRSYCVGPPTAPASCVKRPSLSTYFPHTASGATRLVGPASAICCPVTAVRVSLMLESEPAMPAPNRFALGTLRGTPLVLTIDSRKKQRADVTEGNYRRQTAPSPPSHLSVISRVRCPQPWPRPTTTRSRRRSSGDGIRSARCSIAPGSSDPGSRLLHNPARRSLRRAVWRNPKSVPTASLLVASERIPGSTAARHAHGALLLRGRMPPELASPTARLPSCTAHPAAHPSPETRAPAAAPHIDHSTAPLCQLPVRT